MPRNARVVVPEVPHHVYLRGNNRRRLFSSLGDRLRFLRCLEHGLRESGCHLHQLTLMNNHVHLIALPPTRDALSRLVARTAQRYAQLRNADRSASGKLFEERFHSKIIEDDAALMTTTMYNDANGYRAGLADTAYGHPWSTGPFHAGVAGSRIPPHLWTPSRWYRRLGRDDDERARSYRELITAYVLRDAVKDGPPRAAAEAAAPAPYTLRLERPDRSFARELFSRWLEKA
ncbi:MAG TPA: transposase [Kofleriaceae bacterium]|nr:transposase [Kofleriaceae bacterium]